MLSSREGSITVLLSMLAACGEVSDSNAKADASTDTPVVDAPVEDAPVEDAPIDTSPDVVTQIASGHGVACAVKSSGTVLCWGANEFGQLGVPASATTTTCSAFGRTAPCRATPTAVPGLTEVTSVAVGFHHACAVKQDGSVWCWGLNADGQLGHDPSTDDLCGGQRCRAAPSQVAGIPAAAEVVVSTSHTCVRTSAGAALCWGVNANGQLGNGAAGPSSSTPTNVSGLTSGVTRIATAGYSHTTCAVKGGEVYCWGIAFGEGNLGHDPAIDPACTGLACAKTPVKVPSLTGVSDLAVGERTVCVAVAGGAVRCWGSNLFGQLGISATEPSGYTHRAVPGLSQVVALSGSMAVTCARAQSGALTCWGLASTGAIGDGSITGSACSLASCRPTPSVVPLASAPSLHAAGSSSLSLDATGTLVGWGANGFGELGHAPGTGGDMTCGDGTCAASPSTLVIP